MTHFLYSEVEAMRAVALCQEMADVIKTYMKDPDIPLPEEYVAHLQNLLDREEVLRLKK